MALSRAASERSVKLSSTATSNASDNTEHHSSIETRVCLIGEAGANENLRTKLKRIKQVEILAIDRVKRCNGRNKYKKCIIKVGLDITFVTSNDGHEYLDQDDSCYETVFIISDFESNIFNELKQARIRILGPPVIAAVALSNEPLPYNSRPLFCTCMQGLTLCFTNFETKEHLAHLVTLCHYMGASIRKEMSLKIDYLITNSLHGPKYRTAVSLGTPVMKEKWVHQCWAARNREVVYKATDEEFVSSCKSKPFEGCILSFLGFSGEEKMHMEEQAVQQGGTICAVGHPTCTHLVVDEHTVKSLPFVPEGRIYIVVQEVIDSSKFSIGISA